MEISYFGIVTLINLENVLPSDYESAKKTGSEDLLDESRIKLVHYPDCQQLIIWLPVDWISYLDMVITDIPTGEEIWRKEIRLVVSGSIQIILDTLPFAPGDMSINITKKDGLQHIIHVKKYPEGIYPEKPKIITEIVPDEDKAPIVYRDGFGNILPDEDLILRQNIIDKTINKITRRLEYVSQGRDGKVIYIEGEKRISFYMEAGAYDCLFFLNIPSIAEWEKTTSFPQSEREDIINFIAEQTRRDQASSCKYKISETEITYYRK